MINTLQPPFKPEQEVGMLDIVLFSANETVVTDPNGLLIAIFENTLDLTPIEGCKCVVTGEEAMGIQTDSMQVCVRPDIVQKMALLALSPEEWRTLIKLAPKEHKLCSASFYDEDGYAIQSKLEFMPEYFMYVPIKDRPKSTPKPKVLQIVSQIKLH